MLTRDERTHCDPWLECLSEYLDGDLSDSRRRDLERHLSACAGCRATLAELRQVAARASAWNEPSDPPTDLWPGIAARLEPRRPAWWRLSIRAPLQWPLPRLAAAAVALVVVAVAGGVIVRRLPARQAAVLPAPDRAVSAPAPRASHDPGYEATVATLRREAGARLTHDPHVVEVLDENLATLDAAIANYESALTADPADALLRRRVEQARRTKIDVLRRAVSLTAEGNE